jgi:hypothetical protein
VPFFIPPDARDKSCLIGLVPIDPPYRSARAWGRACPHMSPQNVAWALGPVLILSCRPDRENPRCRRRGVAAASVFLCYSGDVGAIKQFSERLAIRGNTGRAAIDRGNRHSQRFAELNEVEWGETARVRQGPSGIECAKQHTHKTLQISEPGTLVCPWNGMLLGLAHLNSPKDDRITSAGSTLVRCLFSQ